MRPSRCSWLRGGLMMNWCVFVLVHLHPYPYTHISLYVHLPLDHSTSSPPLFPPRFQATYNRETHTILTRSRGLKSGHIALRGLAVHEGKARLLTACLSLSGSTLGGSRVDGWMDGWMDGWVGGWLAGCVLECIRQGVNKGRPQAMLVCACVYGTDDWGLALKDSD
jgi:hypothetical protein